MNSARKGSELPGYEDYSQDQQRSPTNSSPGSADSKPESHVDYDDGEAARDRENEFFRKWVKTYSNAEDATETPFDSNHTVMYIKIADAFWNQAYTLPTSMHKLNDFTYFKQQIIIKEVKSLMNLLVRNHLKDSRWIQAGFHYRFSSRYDGASLAEKLWEQVTSGSACPIGYSWETSEPIMIRIRPRTGKKALDMLTNECSTTRLLNRSGVQLCTIQGTEVTGQTILLAELLRPGQLRTIKEFLLQHHDTRKKKDKTKPPPNVFKPNDGQKLEIMWMKNHCAMGLPLWIPGWLRATPSDMVMGTGDGDVISGWKNLSIPFHALAFKTDVIPTEAVDIIRWFILQNPQDWLVESVLAQAVCWYIRIIRSWNYGKMKKSKDWCTRPHYVPLREFLLEFGSYLAWHQVHRVVAFKHPFDWVYDAFKGQWGHNQVERERLDKPEVIMRPFAMFPLGEVTPATMPGSTLTSAARGQRIIYLETHEYLISAMNLPDWRCIYFPDFRMDPNIDTSSAAPTRTRQVVLPESWVDRGVLKKPDEFIHKTVDHIPIQMPYCLKGLEDVGTPTSVLDTRPAAPFQRKELWWETPRRYDPSTMCSTPKYSRNLLEGDFIASQRAQDWAVEGVENVGTDSVKWVKPWVIPVTRVDKEHLSNLTKQIEDLEDIPEWLVRKSLRRTNPTLEPPSRTVQEEDELFRETNGPETPDKSSERPGDTSKAGPSEIATLHRRQSGPSEAATPQGQQPGPSEAATPRGQQPPTDSLRQMPSGNGPSQSTSAQHTVSQEQNNEQTVTDEPFDGMEREVWKDFASQTTTASKQRIKVFDELIQPVEQMMSGTKVEGFTRLCVKRYIIWAQSLALLGLAKVMIRECNIPGAREETAISATEPPLPIFEWDPPISKTDIHDAVDCLIFPDNPLYTFQFAIVKPTQPSHQSFHFLRVLTRQLGISVLNAGFCKRVASSADAYGEVLSYIMYVQAQFDIKLPKGELDGIILPDPWHEVLLEKSYDGIPLKRMFEAVQEGRLVVSEDQMRAKDERKRQLDSAEGLGQEGHRHFKKRRGIRSGN